jgi:hypothetical protein
MYTRNPTELRNVTSNIFTELIASVDNRAAIETYHAGHPASSPTPEPARRKMMHRAMVLARRRPRTGSGTAIGGGGSWR